KGDLNGYAVIAGSGRTIIVLYGEHLPLAAAVIRGPDVDNVVQALETLRSDGPTDFFAMTYHLPDGAPAALSGLFARPIRREVLTDPRPQLKAVLARELEAGFTGSIVVRYQDILWATLLLVDGDIIGCYGSDDPTLKGTIDDAMALLHLDELEVAIHPGFRDAELDEAISFGSTSYLAGEGDEEIAETEAAMITLLSELEAGITAIAPSDEPARLVLALIDAYQKSLELIQDDRTTLVGDPPAHPLLETHWDTERRAVDTGSLLTTLEMADIPDAWLAAADALILALQASVEQQLTWLSLADKLSATALKEALSDLLLDARGKVRAWRQERRAVEAGTISPFAEYSPGSTVR
ncbi:MAG TPA: hypothetical protein VKZ96_12980, partial [Thermomicrobiales bacterium]|nr:hypothetical protein [Thermomicrobiales bacterium]